MGLNELEGLDGAVERAGKGSYTNGEANSLCHLKSVLAVRNRQIAFVDKVCWVFASGSARFEWVLCDITETVGLSSHPGAVADNS